MTTQTYKSKGGEQLYRPVMTEGEYREADGEGVGFCLACGADRHGVEPDAERYTCEVCQRPKVYGLEQLLVMGLVKLIA